MPHAAAAKQINERNPLKIEAAISSNVLTKRTFVSKIGLPSFRPTGTVKSAMAEIMNTPINKGDIFCISRRV
jgi:hypothetical protein